MGSASRGRLRLVAVFFEPGSSLFYYTGVRWGLSERMFALVLPARGEPAYVCPAFEQDCMYITEQVDKPFS